MSDTLVYAIKGDEEWAQIVFKSLGKGVGRFGWSFCKPEDFWGSSNSLLTRD